MDQYTKDLIDLVKRMSWYISHHYACEMIKHPSQVDTCTCGYIETQRLYNKFLITYKDMI